MLKVLDEKNNLVVAFFDYSIFFLGKRVYVV